MKIRIRGNSVRFRLTQSEVKQLSDTGSVTSQTHFGERIFTYQVQTQEGIDQLKASFQSATITLLLPKAWGQDWYTNPKVGFQNQDGALQLLLEKDFTCLDNRMEDESDNYPNPKQFANQ